jgi:hypothetical protein
MTLQRLYIHYIQIFSYSARIHFEGDWLPRGYIRRFALQIRIKMSLSFRIEFQAPKDYNVKPFMYLLILKYYIFACSILKLLIRQTYQTAQLAPLKTSNDSVKTTNTGQVDRLWITCSQKSAAAHVTMTHVRNNLDASAVRY